MIVSGRQGKDFVLIPAYIFRDERLNSIDLCLISAIYSYADKDQKKSYVKISKLLAAAKITEDDYYRSLRRLKKFGWVKDVKKVNLNGDAENEYWLGIFDKVADKATVSKLVKAWSKFFGTRLIKYDNLEELVDFINCKGLEDELVIKVMEYAGKKACADPLAYTRAILLNFCRTGIFTVEDYLNKGVCQNGEQICQDNRKEAERTEDEIAQEYYEKGYR